MRSPHVSMQTDLQYNYAERLGDDRGECRHNLRQSCTSGGMRSCCNTCFSQWADPLHSFLAGITYG